MKRKLSKLDILRLESNPWDKLPEESDIAFKCFDEYKKTKGRQIGATGVLVGKSADMMYVYAEKFRWKERAHEWDMYLDKMKQLAQLKEIEDMIDRHSTHSMAIEKVLMKPVQSFMNKLRSQSEEIDNMDMKELLGLVLQVADRLPKVVDIERKSRGVPTEINRQNLDVTTKGESIKPEVNIIVSGSKSNLIPDNYESNNYEDKEDDPKFEF